MRPSSTTYRRLDSFLPGFWGEIPVRIHSNGSDLYQHLLDGPFPEATAAEWPKTICLSCVRTYRSNLHTVNQSLIYIPVPFESSITRLFIASLSVYHFYLSTLGGHTRGEKSRCRLPRVVYHQVYNVY
jgi:hypothetical protein